MLGKKDDRCSDVREAQPLYGKSITQERETVKHGTVAIAQLTI
jgi:hypothetical protein